MKRIKAFSLLLCSFTLFQACKNESKPPVMAAPAESALPSAPESPKPEVYVYLVSVDKLNLRDQSSKNGKVVTQLAEGDFVEGNGEVSTNKEEVTLRDIPYNEPYFKVKSLQAVPQTGWAYSAALVPVYAGSRNTLPDVSRLSPFTAYLKTLNVRKLESGKKALDYVAKNLGNAQGTLADASFILLEHFLFRMETEGEFYTMTEAISWTDADFQAVADGTFNMAKYPVTKTLAENGFRLGVGEGAVFPVVDWSKLGAMFTSKVTPPMKSYIEQSILDQKEQVWDDGGIILPLEQVADRAAWWEKFNQANPYFVRSEETRLTQHSLFTALTCGADNSPVFGGDQDMVLDEYKKVWAYVQQKYAGTELGKSVKAMAELVAAEGGKRTKKVEALVQKYLEE